MRNFKNVSSVVLIFFFSLCGSVSAGEEPTDTSSMSVPRDFKAEKEFMVDDLTEKLSVIADARSCAMDATNVDELDGCTTAFRQAIISRQKQG